MATSSFEFVIQNPQDNGFSQATKTKIRRQAMKAVGQARRQTSRQKKHKLSETTPVAHEAEYVAELVRRDSLCIKTNQLPDSASSQSTTSVRNGTDLASPSPPMPASGLELFILDHNVSPTDLSALTSIHVGAVASIVLADGAAKLRQLLSFRQHSYFEHLYSRYGRSPCLDDAVQALILKAQELLAPSAKTSNAMVLSQYGKALNSLQAAFSDEDRWTDPDTLCATALLAMFDLLNSGTTQNWSKHMVGAKRLLQLRGPDSFKTDYEQSLFVALGRPIVTETFRHNQICFLEDPEWQSVFSSSTTPTETFSDRSPLGIEMFRIVTRLPGATKRLGDVICDECRTAEQIDAVRQEVRALYMRIRQWQIRFQTALIEAGPATLAADKEKRIEWLGTGLAVSVVSSRLLGSVSLAERFILEDEVELSASHIKDMGEKIVGKNYRVGFYMMQKYLLVSGTLATTDLWRQPCPPDRTVIEAWKFRRWCEAIPRQAP